MSGFAVEFLGCKVSLSDAQAIRERLSAEGHVEVGPDEADVRVVNGCCVTAEALAKSRKAARRAARAAGRVYLTGCAANLADPGAGTLPANVTVLRVRPDRAPDAVSAAVGPLGCVGGPPPAFARTRAYVKIQDGCSFACSYCVIPAVRGAGRSRSLDAVLRDASRRLGQGHRELVLTGVNLGCFRDRGQRAGLPALIGRLCELPGLDRLRLSSIEVNHLDDALLRAMAADPRVAPHLHVPLQSGDDGVLRAMRRRYARDRFLRRVERARELIPGLNLTSDVIVGHPAEDAAAFERTLSLVGEAGFTAVHVFPYSPRPDTVDAASDPVPAAEKRRRSEALRELSDRAGAAYRRTKLGRRELVLVESAQGRGYSADYTPYVVAGAAPGSLVAVRATGLGRAAVIGTMCA